MKTQVRVPGKLYLAGEYAVVEAGYPALIAAINQYLTVTIEDSAQSSVYSSQQGVTVLWLREGGRPIPKGEVTYPLIFSAIQIAETYASSVGQPPSCSYALSVDSQLDDHQSGVKYGLGSSGAVTVATIKAVLTFLGLNIDAFRLYQLAAIAQLQLGMAGSFGDLAASSYGGVIAYRSVDRDWLKEVLGKHSLLEVLEMPWKDVAIERLNLPKTLSLLIGWTGRAASTARLVSQVGERRYRVGRDIAYRSFLEKSQLCLEGMIRSCHEQDALAFQKGIAKNRRILQDFARNMELVIETPALATLCRLAEEEGAVAKSSGAGGGDCGICFISQENQSEVICQKWQTAGILPLDFAVADEVY